ncbi:MAG: DnaJ domain-containing protein [Hyphomicrobiaceae bacterium]
MRFFLLGSLALIAALLLVRWFVRANPAQLARGLTLGGGVAALAAGALLMARGAAAAAVPLAMLGLWLLSGRSHTTFKPFGQRSQGQWSRVTTDHLEMELEHDTGAIRGRVLKGIFAGRQIERLLPQELALLWQDCRHVDPQSAQIIEAYLDRVHPSWRDDVARGERRMASGDDGRMSAEEAYEILGLKPGASRDDIRRAHRELMLKLHPDRGGSTYLASKINEAKDVLLDGEA